MSRTFILAIAAAAVLSAPLAASAQGVFLAPPSDVIGGQQLSGQDRQLRSELRRYGFGNVDVTRLSNRQRVIINQFVHSGRSEGDIRGLIRTTLRSR